jgi:hypothetical protein
MPFLVAIPKIATRHVPYQFIFLVIYSQVAPKIMKWHQHLRTKTCKKMDEKAKPTPKFSTKWMKLSSLDENITNEWM